MPFDNEDLKLLKENGYQLFGYSTEKLEALIRRLEAAENICLFQQTHYFGKAPELENLYNQWFKSRGDGGRKAAGKK